MESRPGRRLDLPLEVGALRAESSVSTACPSLTSLKHRTKNSQDIKIGEHFLSGLADIDMLIPVGITEFFRHVIM